MYKNYYFYGIYSEALDLYKDTHIQMILKRTNWKPAFSKFSK